MTAPDPSTSLRAALDLALSTTPHLPRDVAAIALARHYADLLDDAGDRLRDAAEGESEDGRDFARMVAVVAKIGPRLEAVLDKLGMTPGARPSPRGGEQDGRPDPAAVALARLQAAAESGGAAGVDYAAAVDPAVAEADA